jgi:hypothetical protein
VIPEDWAAWEALCEVAARTVRSGETEPGLERLRAEVNALLPEGGRLAYFDFLELVRAAGHAVLDGTPRRLRLLEA